MGTGVGPAPDPESRPGAAARTIGWSTTKARQAVNWSIGARSTHRSVDVGFRLADRDKRVAAGVLAGGVAYRMFFWLLSISVLATGALGLAGRSWVDSALSEMRIGPVATETINDFVRGTDQARWWVLLVGGWLVLWTGYLGAKALVLVHAAVWGLPAPQGRKQWAMSLTFTGTALAFLVSMTIADRVHARGGALGLVAIVVVTAIPFAIWLGISRLLPHPGVPWTDLVPGALLVGIGVQAFYQFATWFLAPKLANATELYGLLGIAATALFWLYILGRLMIGAVTLNASVREQRIATSPLPHN